MTDTNPDRPLVTFALFAYNQEQYIREADQNGTRGAHRRALRPHLCRHRLPARCRATAEAVFSLESGTEAYREIYADILKSEDFPCAA